MNYFKVGVRGGEGVGPAMNPEVAKMMAFKRSQPTSILVTRYTPFTVMCSGSTPAHVCLTCGEHPEIWVSVSAMAARRSGGDGRGPGAVPQASFSPGSSIAPGFFDGFGVLRKSVSETRPRRRSPAVRPCPVRRWRNYRQRAYIVGVKRLEPLTLPLWKDVHGARSGVWYVSRWPAMYSRSSTALKGLLLIPFHRPPKKIGVSLRRSAVIAGDSSLSPTHRRGPSIHSGKPSVVKVHLSLPSGAAARHTRSHAALRESSAAATRASCASTASAP